MFPLTRRLTVLAACAALAGLARAQTALPDQIDLPRLVDLCAQRLDVGIDYDSKVVVGSVTLRLRGEITDPELWALTNLLLANRGFTTVRQSGDSRGLSVVKIEQAAGLSRVEDLTGPAPLQELTPLPGFRSVMVRAKHRPVREIVDGLKVLLSKPGGAVTEVPGAGSAASVAPSSPSSSSSPGPPTGNASTGAIGGLLVLSDLSPRVEQALRLLERLDTPVDGAVIEEIPLKYLSATQGAALVTQMATRRESVMGRKAVGEIMPAFGGNAVLVIAPKERLAYWRDLIVQLDKREGVTTVNYTPTYFALKDVAKLIEETIVERGGTGGNPASPVAAPALGGGDERFRIVVDDLTGTLVITATATQHQKIAELMARLDLVPPAARRPVRSYTLKNRPVKEVMAVLGQMLVAGVLDESVGQSEPAGSTPPGASGIGAVMPGEPYRPDIAPGIPAKSSVASQTRPVASPMDVRAPNTPGSQRITSVLSMSSDEATNTLIAVGEPRLLAQLEALLIALDVRQPQVMLEVLLLSLTDSQTLALGIELDKITRTGDAQFRLSSVFGLSATNAGSITTGVGGTGGTITVLSPMEFSIVIKALETLNQGRSLSVPRLLVSNNQKGDFTSNLQQPVQTSTTQNQTTTQGFAGYEQAGTSVNVQPQITQGDHLLLQYSVTLSSFVGQGAGTLPPPRQENKLASQVSIPDGYTIALGGIELTTTGEQTSQIPLLGSIPLIGEAFKSRSNSQNRARFFVFIHAEIMRNTTFEDLKYLSDVTTNQIGIDDGFPSVSPQVMR